MQTIDSASFVISNGVSGPNRTRDKLILYFLGFNLPVYS